MTSCVCQGCLDGGQSECENKEHTKGWKRVSIKLKQFMNTGHINWCGKSIYEPTNTPTMEQTDEILDFSTNGITETFPSTNPANICIELPEKITLPIFDSEDEEDDIKEKTQQPMSKILNWNTIYEGMNNCTDYDSLSRFMQPNIPYMYWSTFLSGRHIDTIAKHHLPAHLKQKMKPKKTYGDGNCLPRCFSWLFYGTDDKHLVMQLQLVKEAYFN